MSFGLNPLNLFIYRLFWASWIDHIFKIGWPSLGLGELKNQLAMVSFKLNHHQALSMLPSPLSYPLLL